MVSKALFITGISKGIGKALFLKSGNKGFRTYGIGRSNPDNRDSFLELDLGNASAIESFNFPELPPGIQEVWLINNAGLIGPISHVTSQSYTQISEVIQVNLIGIIHLSNLFLKAYGDRKGLKIINLSSGAAHSPIASWATYCTSKAGLEMYAAVLQKECDESGSNVKVFSIAPGVVDTDMQAEIRSSDESLFSSRSKFIDLNTNGELTSTETAASTLIEFVINQTIPGSYTLRDYYV
jgi:benzil reductase ((S)-benzoin forming)